MSDMDSRRARIRAIANITDHVDTDAAARSIRSNIYFRGINVWILAFSIIIASVGLNVNSTAVIIGAMLISPLMGPIIGIGLGLGVNDTLLVRDGAKNLLVMVVISLAASFLYFLLTPLKLANPTELLARTNPSIYDVIIAFFGGLAGIFEISRKEKGTVLSGVAIATALMPPLCTAGYGLARLNMHYFLGALLLFCINGIFIILATYLTVKYLHFKEVEFKDEAKARRDRRLITAIVLLVTIPSIWSAFRMVRDNRFDKNAEAFVAQNKTQRNSFIYDYRIDPRGGGRITLYFTGGALTAADKNALFLSAAEHGIKSNQLEFVEKNLGMDESETFEKMFKVIYDRTDSEIRLREEEIRKRDEEIRQLKEELSRLRDSGSVKAPVSAAAPASAPPAEEAPSGKP